jgi:hypothetical protein
MRCASGLPWSGPWGLQVQAQKCFSRCPTRQLRPVIVADTPFACILLPLSKWLFVDCVSSLLVGFAVIGMCRGPLYCICTIPHPCGAAQRACGVDSRVRTLLTTPRSPPAR